MKELKIWVISWWSFKNQDYIIKSFRYRKSALKFAVKLAEDTDTSLRRFTGYYFNKKTEEFNF